MNEYVPFLSKSRFIKGMQCHKALWLQTHRPELKDEIGEDRQAIFDAGHTVGSLAQQMFPDGVEVPFDGVSLSEQIEMTRNLVASGTSTIFEAAFSYDNVFIKADILNRTSNAWHLGEVKASTDAKEYYINDIAVQYHVITGCGVPVETASLVLINTSYVRVGDIEPEKLFTWVDVTEEVLLRQEQIKAEIVRQRSMLKSDMPQIGIGPYCSNPYDCDYMGHCWAHVSSPSIFDFADLGKPDGFKYYKQGIINMKDVPRDSLGWRQQLQYDGTLHKKNVVDTDAIREFIDSLWYPLAFMDFETTCMTPVPLFDGTRPFQSVPFQYSLHWANSPKDKLNHCEFLGHVKGDPQKQFLTTLLDSIPENACVLTWNKGFEGKVLRALADRFPKYRKRIKTVLDNMVDLMAPFRSKHIYHWQFEGSYSIKSVLPALVPELTYESLNISDGGTAAESWLRMRASTNTDEQEQIKRDLLEYCHLDTLAMVRILDKMKGLV